MKTEKQAEEILGRKLKKSEQSLLQLFCDDDNYEMYKNEQGNLSFKRVKP